MRVAVVDTETTGMDPTKDRVVELAVVTLEDGPWRVTDAWHSLVDPGMPIPAEASAIHHIVDADVAGMLTLDEAIRVSPLAGADLHVAHHAAFDQPFLPGLSPWLCSWRASLHIWPDAPSHKNQVLRYWVPGLHQEVRAAPRPGGSSLRHPMELPPHRALPDAWVTAHVLLHMLRERGLTELQELAVQPVVLRTVSFGKHRGMPWGDVPPDYLQWAVRQDFDGDVMHTINHHIREHQARRSALFRTGRD